MSSPRSSTPAKSGRPPGWGRSFLENAPAFVPPQRKVQLILDVQDFPASLLAAAESQRPSWGLQMFGGASVFAAPEQARIFAGAVARIRQALGG